MHKKYAIPFLGVVKWTVGKPLCTDRQATEVGGGFNEPGTRTEVTIIIEVSKTNFAKVARKQRAAEDEGIFFITFTPLFYAKSQGLVRNRESPLFSIFLGESPRDMAPRPSLNSVEQPAYFEAICPTNYSYRGGVEVVARLTSSLTRSNFVEFVQYHMV